MQMRNGLLLTLTDGRQIRAVGLEGFEVLLVEALQLAVLQMGDWVQLDVYRGPLNENEEPIESNWVRKTGQIYEVHEGAACVMVNVRFSDGDVQAIDGIIGNDRFPYRNVAPQL